MESQPNKFSFCDTGPYWSSRAAQLAQSPKFRATVDRLRRDAVGSSRSSYRLTTGRLDQLSWAALGSAVAAGWSPSRPRRWAEEKVYGSDPERGNSHAAKYVKSCIQSAGQYLGPTVAATMIHELVGRAGYLLEIASSPPGWPAPTGPAASSIDAHFAEGTSPRMWQRWRRDHFHVDIEGP